MKSILFSFIILFPTLFSCKTKTEKNSITITPSFYHWKTVFSPSDMEVRKLDSLSVKKLYCKFFDVEWNKKKNSITPTAVFKISNKPSLNKFQIVPTIFITNECLYNLKAGKETELAQNIAKLYRSTAKQLGAKPVKEIQIDCDWTEATKDKYFLLLAALKQEIAVQVWSATIRLHQIKFMSKTGVPPIDRGMLMCYNMGNLRDASAGNSIIEIEELKNYTDNISLYPLPLDVAYPLFEWAVLFRKGNFKGLLQHLPDNFFSSAIFSSVINGYKVNKDTSIAGASFLKDDFIRIEKSDLPTVKKANNIIKSLIKNDTYAVSFYHLDSIILDKFPINELKNIYGNNP